MSDVRPSKYSDGNVNFFGVKSPAKRQFGLRTKRGQVNGS